MIIRHARDSDAEQLESFDLGASGSWLDEVAEIVAGLVAWRSDPHAEHRDRQVIVAVTDGHVVGVTAHERLVRSGGRVWNDHRYLMVTAVRGDQQRTGLARLLVESVLADLRSRGCTRSRMMSGSFPGLSGSKKPDAGRFGGFVMSPVSTTGSRGAVSVFDVLRGFAWRDLSVDVEFLHHQSLLRHALFSGPFDSRAR